jgi:hypothetical protein
MTWPNFGAKWTKILQSHEGVITRSPLGMKSGANYYPIMLATNCLNWCSGCCESDTFVEHKNSNLQENVISTNNAPITKPSG